ncbi:TPA: hypothetical protein DIV55_05155 [Patescibacteria group bacterium]|uniref:Glycosyltransferase RgtA/B/C/D-like domain-containing protein n=1 Tax=Candidatus Gottesmanbacteria bacterium GW2011_GWA1_43_11 TaxID=1618436 RepID=A0A0G1FHJ6_9BACT|nr:MAG: hypothetical protein UV59_C0001G0036 [Candidatus Gottesmanbacteria bacterium GW2011_GWA1_43_11]HCS79097.1 hypothetical protein [Patescibacteria group bacterium]
MRSSKVLVAILLLAFFFRFFQLTSVPPSLHGDEIGVGYNAWTLLTSGAGEYGEKFPLTFRADISPLIFYLTVPAIAFFGPTEFAIRSLSTLTGVLTVFVAYVFCLKLCRLYGLLNSRICLLFTLLMAISPWHIQVSRIGHDASLALLIQMIAMIIFLHFLEKQKPGLLLLSAFLFGLSVYAYHTPSFTTPVLLLLLLVTFRKILNRFRPILLLAFFIFIAVITPIALHRISKPLGDTRFGGINIFIREQPDENLLVTIPRRFAVSFINQLNPVSWFWDTSSSRYFNVKNNGFLYVLDFGLISLGIWNLKSKLRLFLLGWIIIGLSAGALTTGPVNAGRILFILPPLLLFASIGFFSVLQIMLKKNLNLLVVLVSVYILGLSNFLIQYFNVSPQLFYKKWEYGAKEAAKFSLSHESQVQKIVITDQIKQGYIYVLYYGQKSPAWIQSVFNKKHPYIGYSAFGNYEFRTINWERDRYLKQTLFIGTPDEIPSAFFINSISAPDGTVLYGIVQTD